MNLDDSGLVDALDQLAAIGQDVAQDDESASEAGSATNDAPNVIIADPLPAPKPIDPPAIAEPIAELIPEPLPVSSTESAQAPPVAESAGESHPALMVELHHELELPASSVPVKVVSTAPAGSSGWKTVLATILFGFVMFVAGYFTGRSTPPNPAVAARANTEAGVKGLAAGNNIPPESLTPALRGRVTYKTDGGESRPDRGARVLVLPAQRQGTVRISVVGFRASDNDADVAFALHALRSLGGDVAVVAENGNYEARLPSAGTYKVLCISRFQQRPDDQPLSASVRSALGEWFDRPQKLLGQLSFRLDEFRYKGAGTEIRDYSFDRT